MKYLLDTCVLIWVVEGNEEKLSSFYDLFNDPNNYFSVSVASYWEITIKKMLGKLEIPDTFLEMVDDSQIKWLPIELRHVTCLEKLPLYHNDPFDRLIISQARIDGFQVLTVDEKVLQYLKK